MLTKHWEINLWKSPNPIHQARRIGCLVFGKTHKFASCLLEKGSPSMSVHSLVQLTLFAPNCLHCLGLPSVSPSLVFLWRVVWSLSAKIPFLPLECVVRLQQRVQHQKATFQPTRQSPIVSIDQTSSFSSFSEKGRKFIPRQEKPVNTSDANWLTFQ